MSQSGVSATNMSVGISPAGILTGSQNPDCRDGPARKWHARYGTCVARESDDRDEHLKKTAPERPYVNEPILRTLAPQDVNVVIQPVNEAEIDEMWSYVGDKGHQRWLGHAIAHHRGTILASVFGTHTDPVFVTLKQLLAPCGITRFYPDDWGPTRAISSLSNIRSGKRIHRRLTEHT